LGNVSSSILVALDRKRLFRAVSKEVLDGWMRILTVKIREKAKLRGFSGG